MTAKSLIERLGDPEAIFRADISMLEQVKGLKGSKAHSIVTFKDFSALEAELGLLEKKGIRCLFCTDKEYPQRLLSWGSSPILLYYRGNADLNAARVISVIGTRFPTEYGRKAVEKLLEELAPYNPMIVSGLAFGIDAVSHKAALKYGLSTIGVLGSGLNRIYPPEHIGLARDMEKRGGLLTEFSPDVSAERYQFPIRNGIIAGISDAVIVAETGPVGGSMLTVSKAIEFGRKVFAIPGRVSDEKSSGCNTLIHAGRARLLPGPSQLIAELEWNRPPSDRTQPVHAIRSSRIKQPALTKQPDQTKQAKQAALFPAEPVYSPSESEKVVLQLLREQGALYKDDLIVKSRLGFSELALALWNLEKNKFIRKLPWTKYELNV